MPTITLTCAVSEENFTISEVEQALYKKLDVPLPTLCPRERMRRRLHWRNEWVFYKRQCDHCHKPMISTYDPERIPNVYCVACFWSDDWDAADHARDFEFSRPFFEQWHELWKSTPKITTMNDNGIGSINCEYTNDFSFGKNCYMIAESWQLEDCMYGTQFDRCRDCMDGTSVFHSELSYDVIASDGLYNCQHMLDSHHSRDCIMGINLRNCSDCIGCVGLRNKQYYIWNQPHTKEEYEQIKLSMQLDTLEGRAHALQQFETFSKQFPFAASSHTQCENVTGNFLINCKDAHYSVCALNLHNCWYMTTIDKAVDCMDIHSVGNAELCYEALTPDNSYLCRFAIHTWKCQYVDYSENCHSSSNLFGCVGLKRKTHHILNKAYSEEEYFKMKTQIIEHMKQTGEWGEFFPIEIAPFTVEESLVPYWIPGEMKVSTDCHHERTVPKQELAFYEKMKLPQPERCYLCRHEDRARKIGGIDFHERNCGKCGVAVLTNRNNEIAPLIYCETCYLEYTY